MQPVIDPRDFRGSMQQLKDLINLNTNYLLGHPDLNIGHTVYRGKQLERRHVIQGGRMLSADEIEACTARNRAQIEAIARRITLTMIDTLADILQLDESYKTLPPTIICSDSIDNKNAWSAGIDCGFYPMSGSYFFANLGSSGRIDSRIQSVFGPIIHFDTEMIVHQDLGVIVEESLHYLQWYYQMPPELREKITQVGREIGLSSNGERADTESAWYLTPAKNAPKEQHKRSERRRKIFQEISEGIVPATDDEALASKILFEACAELLRIQLGISERREAYSNLENWSEQGILGWTIPITKDQPEESSVESSTEQVKACYDAMIDKSWMQFIDAVCVRNDGGPLSELCRITAIGSEGEEVFPQQLCHFLGYMLGQELSRTGSFDNEAGMQEASLTFFSYLMQPSERLQYLIGMVRK